MIPTLTFVYDRRKRANKKTKGAVEISVYVNGKRKYISTGVRLFKNEWRNGAVTGCRPDWKELNEQLRILYKRVSEIVTRQLDEGRLDINAIPNILEHETIQDVTFIDYAKDVAERRMRDLSEGTRKRYKVFFKYLQGFRHIKYFSDLTEKNIIRMDDDLRDKGLQEGSRWNYHKFMKIFVREAISDGRIEQDPYQRLNIKRGESKGIERCLTNKEFERLCKVKPINSSIEKVQDLFIFQTYTMMSYADLQAFDYKACNEVDGQLVYVSNRIKTKQQFVVIITKEARRVLEKYNYVLPRISDQKYNMYLKSLAALAKIDKEITSHWARHTGATLLRNKGVEIGIISKMMGHSKPDITARVYAKLEVDTIVRTMANLK